MEIVQLFNMPAVFLKSATRFEDLPKSTKPHIALVGRSNVGKSSLLNRLTQQKGLAYESAQPGRTRCMNVFQVDNRFLLVDLPGYGFAAVSKTERLGFGDMVRDYLWRATHLKLVLLLIDARVGPTELDRDMIAYLGSAQIPVVLVVNKIDKLSTSESIAVLQRVEASYPHLECIPHSTVTNKGSGELRQAIDRALRETGNTTADP